MRSQIGSQGSSHYRALAWISRGAIASFVGAASAARNVSALRDFRVCDAGQGGGLLSTIAAIWQSAAGSPA